MTDDVEAPALSADTSVEAFTAADPTGLGAAMRPRWWSVSESRGGQLLLTCVPAGGGPHRHFVLGSREDAWDLYLALRVALHAEVGAAMRERAERRAKVEQLGGVPADSEPRNRAERRRARRERRAGPS